MFYLIKVFGVGTLAFVLALIKCCGVAINVAGLPNVRETLLRNQSVIISSKNFTLQNFQKNKNTMQKINLNILCEFIDDI